MTASPTPARTAAPHRNHAASRGPATPGHEARSSGDLVRHAPPDPLHLLPREDRAAFEALRADLAARHAPADAVEAHWVGEIAHAMWRQRRLRAVEAAALARAEVGTNEPETAAGRPSLATLARCRARVERDLRLAEERLAGAKRGRPRLPAAALAAATAPRLRWLADGLERHAAAAAANDDGGTNEPEAVVPPPASRNEPEGRPCPPRTARTNEPEPPPSAPASTGRKEPEQPTRASSPSPTTNEPRGGLPPPRKAGTNEPEPPPRSPNRAERRRRAALARRAGPAPAAA